VEDKDELLHSRLALEWIRSPIAAADWWLQLAIDFGKLLESLSTDGQFLSDDLRRWRERFTAGLRAAAWAAEESPDLRYLTILLNEWQLEDCESSPESLHKALLDTGLAYYDRLQFQNQLSVELPSAEAGSPSVPTIKTVNGENLPESEFTEERTTADWCRILSCSHGTFRNRVSPDKPGDTYRAWSKRRGRYRLFIPDLPPDRRSEHQRLERLTPR